VVILKAREPARIMTDWVRFAELRK
jgi:hypothetical protein